ncbi:MAG: coenzyme F420-0:L-glutamate ligase [Promethearchaeota archaeon]
MEIHAIKTPIIKPGDDLVQVLLDALKDHELELSEKDIIVIAETVMATSQGRIIDLNEIKEISGKANELARKYKMDPRVVMLVLKESDEILGGVDHVVLARTKGLLLANAGIDASNSGGKDKVSLLPEHPWKSIREFRKRLEITSGVKPLGAILADSRVQPLKKGVVGGALSVSGFLPIEDKRGKRDLFGRPLRITQIAIADDLTSAAELLMGEADEQKPFVIIHDAPVSFVNDDDVDESIMLMPEEECLFMNIFKEYLDEKGNDD